MMTLQMTGIMTAGVCIHCFFFHFQAFGIFFLCSADVPELPLSL